MSNTTTYNNSVSKIPCCLCGTYIEPNAANQCSTCLAQQFDLKELLYKNGNLIIHQCRQCRKFARTDTQYEYADIESPQLLSICLKHIPILLKTPKHISKTNPYGGGNTTSTTTQQHTIPLKIIDALWVWTEPHSMRLKLRITIRAEIEGVLVQQRILVEFIIQWKQCNDCNREYTNRTWSAIVQVRQKRDDLKYGITMLEHGLSNNKDIRKHVLKVDNCKYGLDFYFQSLNVAQSFTSYISKIVPMKIKTTQKLVSTDVKSNTANIKHTLSCDMVPLCKHDLILIHKKQHGILSGRLCLVTKISSIIHIIDASPKRTTTGSIEHDYMTEIIPETYYKVGGDKIYPIIQTPQRMIRFIVLDVELLRSQDNDKQQQKQKEKLKSTTNPTTTSDENGNNNDNNNNNDTTISTTTTTISTTTNDNNNNNNNVIYQGPNKTPEVSKYALANIQVARESDMGVNDTIFDCVSHLGHLLQPGDIVLGYDLTSSAQTILSTSSSSLGVVDIEDVVHSNFVMPDVVLVKKVKDNNNNNKNDNSITTAGIDDHSNNNNNNTATTATTNTTNNKDGEENEDETNNHIKNRKQKRLSKKKERRLKKENRRRRELEESAARMGFLDDMAEIAAEHDEDDNDDEQQQQTDFSKQLANDPGLAAELTAAEQQLETMGL